MNFLKNAFLFFFRIFKRLSRRGLNAIETSREIGYKTLANPNLLNPKYLTRLNDLEQNLKSYSPFTLISYGIILLILFLLIKKLFKKSYKILKNLSIKKIKEKITILILKLPKYRAQILKAKEEMKKELPKVFKVSSFKKIEFRDNKQDEYTILQKLEQMSRIDEKTINSGKLTGAVYCGDNKIHNIASEASKIFSYSNLLHADMYCSARFIESQLIKIGLDLFHGKEDSCGMTTSGGTMSILTAMYVYIKRGREKGIKHPEIIIPETAHAAFYKAAEIFNSKCIVIPIDKVTCKVNVNKVKNAINKNTVCIVGSFPNFPHCIADDIEMLSNIALKYNIPLHVDCCLGGFLIAFFNKGNIKVPKFDFVLSGVTSISADLHKYGLCPKGISLLMFSKKEYRRYAFFIYPHFMGGTYITTSFDGSRTGCLIAASYAVLTSLGKNYYTNIAKRINEAVVNTREFIKKECPKLQILGEPYICGIAFKGDKVEYIYDYLQKKGWHTNYIINPIGVSFVFTSANMENDKEFMKDLKEGYDKIQKGEFWELEPSTKVYGMSVPLPTSVATFAFDAYADALLD